MCGAPAQGTLVPALREGQQEPRYHPAVSPQARAAEGDGGPSKALAFFQHPVRYVPWHRGPGRVRRARRLRGLTPALPTQAPLAQVQGL